MNALLLADCRAAMTNAARDLAVCVAYFAAGIANDMDVCSAAADYEDRVRSYHAAVRRSAR